MRKYLWYALGEILLVMAGILLALQVNNWNEQRKADNIAGATLQKLQTELQEAKTDIESSLEVNRMFLRWSDQYLNSESFIDSLKANPHRVFRLISYAPVSLELPVLKQELSSEQLIVDAGDLTYNLHRINRIYDEVLSVQSIAKDLWNDNVVGYFIEKRVYVDFNSFMRRNAVNEEAVINLAYDDEYKNLVAMAGSVNFRLISNYERLLGYLDETLTHIETMK